MSAGSHFLYLKEFIDYYLRADGVTTSHGKIVQNFAIAVEEFLSFY
jgi:hypothetical protein